MFPVDNTIIETMLDLEEIDKDLYRSKNLWLPLGARGVFGNVLICLCGKKCQKVQVMTPVILMEPFSRTCSDPFQLLIGGNVVGQALVAATNTVSSNYSVHVS